MPYDFKGVRIEWLGHASFRITADRTIYIDPYQIEGGRPADIIIITHDHFDHFNLDDIRKILKPDTVIVAAEHCISQLKEIKAGRIEPIKPGSKINVSGVEVTVVPAYNVNKFKEPGVVFHTRQYGGVGVIVKVAGVSIYHAGDTDFIEEMRDIKVDVALLPVSGTYVMTAEEAAKAAEVVKPAVAIPMHYGGFVGTLEDAQKFKRLSKCETVILEKER